MNEALRPDISIWEKPDIFTWGPHTWHNVGYFGSHVDRLNSFQIVLRGGSEMDVGQFEVEFRYARCEWTTGDASGGSGGRGGTPAQAGFDAGNRHDSRVLPGSRTTGILRLCRTSNVSEPGVWRFLITNGRPMRSPGREQSREAALLVRSSRPA
jgi:hypothetical protein